MTLDRAVEAFVRAFSEGKSRTYPYVATRPEPWLWVMQDTPPRKNSRKIEVISTLGDPEHAVQRVAELGLSWHFLCEIHSDPTVFDRIRDDYKRLGYRAVSTEWMFVHTLEQLPELSADFEIRTITTQKQMAAIPQTAGQKRQFREGTTKFAICDEILDYGWVTHVPYGSDSWVSDLWVRKEHRGKGLGRALMTAMLHHAKARGDEHSVLLATSDGAKLYPRLGYEHTATLQMFCPAKRA